MITEEEFLKTVKDHEMQVIQDDGLHRHIRFKKPGTSAYHFDFITWPGYLCYCGDMGTYVFSRLDDMFEFFRTDRQYAKDHGKQLGVNVGYWAEKLKAVDGTRLAAGAMEFDEDKFRSVINEYRVNWIREAIQYGSLNKEERRELWEAVENRVLAEVDCGSSDRAQIAAYDFSWQPGYRYGSERPSWQFNDLFDHNFQRYTHHFLWCCYALAWGIEAYDKAKEAESA